MAHGEIDIDALQVKAHLEGFKKGYAQAIQSLTEPLGAVEATAFPYASGKRGALPLIFFDVSKRLPEGGAPVRVLILPRGEQS